MRENALQLGICDANGFRQSGMPWAFQLAEVDKSSFLSCKTVGFQRVSEDGIDYLVMDRTSHKSNSQNKLPLFQKTVALCYVEGVYPPPTGTLCEQWRVEGAVQRISVDRILNTAPLSSFAQILACYEVRLQACDPGSRIDLRESESTNKGCSSVSLEMFLEKVKEIKGKLERKEICIEDIDKAMAVYRVLPKRMELLR